jgi:pyruvate/2-oxoglutarate dehydrogenase complex dihydrolipoamide dehydrogenase (E3) component
MTHTNDLQPLFHKTRASALNWQTQPTPLFTAPPKQWVGLTDEEIYDYADKFLYSHGSNYGIRSFGKAIEAKLRSKNGY